MPSTSIPVPPACCYCGELVGDNEWDSEPGAGGGYFSSHFRCSSPSLDGPYFVRSLLDGEQYREERRGFTNLNRAIAEADSLARSNSTRWTFEVSPAPTASGVARYDGRLAVRSAV